VSWVNHFQITQDYKKNLTKHPIEQWPKEYNFRVSEMTVRNSKNVSTKLRRYFKWLFYHLLGLKNARWLFLSISLVVLPFAFAFATVQTKFSISLNHLEINCCCTNSWNLNSGRKIPVTYKLLLKIWIGNVKRII
jgi:hypothetical protein